MQPGARAAIRGQLGCVCASANQFTSSASLTHELFISRYEIVFVYHARYTRVPMGSLVFYIDTRMDSYLLH